MFNVYVFQSFIRIQIHLRGKNKKRELITTETANSKQQNKDGVIENQNERKCNGDGSEWVTEIDTIDKKCTQIMIL